LIAERKESLPLKLGDFIEESVESFFNAILLKKSGPLALNAGFHSR